MNKVAITAFVDNAIHFADETNQMTLSGKNLNEKFTFVIFAHPEIYDKIIQRHNVIVYKHLPPQTKYYEDYKFANALEFLKPNEAILKEYTHLIKTDTDVFFTDNLNDYVFDETISFGEGQYSGTERCVEQTYELAAMFGYASYTRMFQVGPTLFGPTKDIINLINLSDILCQQIFYYLCPNGKYDPTGIWPISLYGGTSVLIATEIVLCSIFDKEKLRLTPGVIDANCYSNKSLDGIYHIHQWHGDGLYSKFEARSGIYDNMKPLNNGTISDYCLGIFLKNKEKNRHSIFIQISAYEDNELYKTITDCIEKSSGNNELHFGINVVFKDYDMLIPSVPNLKIERSKAPLNLGVGIGRYIANQFYDGQDFYLQVDAHTRFVQNWDESIIDSYSLYRDQGCNPVLTTYPTPYWYENEKEVFQDNPGVNGIDFKVEDIDLFKRTKFFHQYSKPTEGSIFTKSISGGSVFSSGSIASILPNKKMFNWGEEMLYAIRLFTHGYDLMIPQKQYLYHLYYSHEKPENNFRSISGNDFPSEVVKIEEESNKEIYRIITNNIVSDEGLGDKRTLDDYWYYIGLSEDLISIAKQNTI